MAAQKNVVDDTITDILEYVAYALDMREHSERAAETQKVIETTYTAAQQGFLVYVLKQYVRCGINALAADKHKRTFGVGRL